MYDIDFAGGPFNSYVFTTLQGVVYAVQFKPSPYLFGENFPLTNEIVELVIKVTEIPAGLKPRPDPMIAATVAAIIGDFYEKSSLTITIFICDTADRKHEARWRKFNRWYDYFAPSDYMRIDDAFKDPAAGLTYHCAIIVKQSNPYLREIGLSFMALTAAFNQRK